MKLKPYPEYKDSGVPWLRKVPKHWDIYPNRVLFYERKLKNNLNKKMLSVVIKQGVIPQKELLSNTSKKDSSNEDKSNYKLVLKGDIAYNKMRMWQGAVGASRYEGIVSPAYIVIHPREGLDEWYCHCLFRSPAYIKESHRYSYGICDDQLSLRYEDFKTISTPKPPLYEQKQMVKYITFKSSQIARFIRAKKRMVELLREQKQAIINDAVTGKIDVRTGKPYPKYKPSGVEWLGDIPEDWEVKKLKYGVSFYGGGTPSKAEESFWNGKIPWVSPKDMKTNTILNSLDHISEDAIEKSATKLIGPEAVLIVVRSGILQHSIPVAINKVKVALNQDMKALVPKKYYNSEYLLHLISGCQKQLIVEWTKQGATVESVEYELMANSFQPIPSIKEQLAIVKFIKKECKLIDLVISRTEREIALMQEYRTRLIADVVTGKVDVRDIKVPDVAEEDLIVEDVSVAEETDEMVGGQEEVD